VDATDLVREGEAAAGFEALLGGLARAREAAKDGELQRAAEFVQRWERAVAGFVARGGN
jgi:hypothetical protein